MTKPQAPVAPAPKAAPIPPKPAVPVAAKPETPVAAKPSVPIQEGEAPVVQDQTVSLTFKNQATGKNTLQIIAAVSAEDRVKLVEDPSGQLVAKYVIAKVMHELGGPTNANGAVTVPAKS